MFRKSSILLAAHSEEIPQNGEAGFLLYARPEFGMMVYSRVTEDVKYSGTAALRVTRPPDHGVKPAQHYGSCAHRARLFGDIKAGTRKPPIALSGERLREGKHFGVGGRIRQTFSLVVGAAKYAALGRHGYLAFRNLYYHATGRHFAIRRGLLSLAERHTHEMLIQFANRHRQ